MKRKAVSLVLCVVMILSAMTFSVSADVGEAKTLLKDDFGYSTIKDTDWKKFDGANNGQNIVNKAGINVIDFQFRAGAVRKLDTPVDLDSENVYYASWVQSLNEIPTGISQTLKTGFVNIANENESSSARTILLWQGQNGVDYPTVKLALGAGFGSDISTNDSKINVGTLYNVLMRIEAHKDKEDVIQIKYWQTDTKEPSAWNGEKKDSVTGKREYFEINTGNVQAYFGNLNVEVYSGDKASAADKLIADAKAYAAGNAEKPSIDENSGIIANGVVYNSAKNIISLKTNTYVREIALTKITGSGSETKYTRASKVTAGSDYSVVVKIANDSGDVISDKKYFAAVASYNSAGEMQRVKLCIVDSGNANKNGGLAKTTGLLFDKITADEANGKIRVYVWDAQTLEPITNGVTIDGNKIINY